MGNFGKLNYYMGRRAHVEGRTAVYPEVDFCKHPEAICSPDYDPSIKWVAGFFYHLNAVQPYNHDGWNYYDELIAYVDSGMNTNSFIDGVSGIVNRGCHNPDCGSGALHAKNERRKNFEDVLKAMGLK